MSMTPHRNIQSSENTSVTAAGNRNQLQQGQANMVTSSGGQLVISNQPASATSIQVFDQNIIATNSNIVQGPLSNDNNNDSDSGSSSSSDKTPTNQNDLPSTFGQSPWKIKNENNLLKNALNSIEDSKAGKPSEQVQVTNMTQAANTNVNGDLPIMGPSVTGIQTVTQSVSEQVLLDSQTDNNIEDSITFQSLLDLAMDPQSENVKARQRLFGYAGDQDIDSDQDILQIQSQPYQDHQQQGQNYQQSQHSDQHSRSQLDNNQSQSQSKRTRPKWKSRAQFVLVLMGYAIGLGNIWRFPYLCGRHGGAAFLAVYLFCLVFIAYPLFLTELVIGQYFQKGAAQAFRMLAQMKDKSSSSSSGSQYTFLAYIAAYMDLIILSYYQVVISWAMIYWGRSFNFFPKEGNSGLPWVENESDEIKTQDSQQPLESQSSDSEATSTQQYFDNQVLHDFPSLFLSLLGVWLITFLCLYKGIHSAGKVAYLTVILPFILMLILFIISVQLPGASIGIRYYIDPTSQSNLTSYLFDPTTWSMACGQILFSLSPATGAAVALASFNDKYYKHLEKDAFLISITNSGFSVFSGFVVFAVCGNLVWNKNQKKLNPDEPDIGIESVVQSGPGLAFITFPRALEEMSDLMGSEFRSVPVLISWIFFLVLLMLGLDSSFAWVQTLVTYVEDYREERENQKLQQLQQSMTQSQSQMQQSQTQRYQDGSLSTNSAGMNNDVLQVQQQYQPQYLGGSTGGPSNSTNIYHGKDVEAQGNQNSNLTTNNIFLEQGHNKAPVDQSDIASNISSSVTNTTVTGISQVHLVPQTNSMMSSSVSQSESSKVTVNIVNKQHNIKRKRIIKVNRQLETTFYICSGLFFCGIIYITKNGVTILDTIDHFVPTYCLLFSAVIEFYLFGWVVGVEKIEDMIYSFQQNQSQSQTVTGNSNTQFSSQSQSDESTTRSDSESLYSLFVTDVSNFIRISILRKSPEANLNINNSVAATASQRPLLRLTLRWIGPVMSFLLLMLTFFADVMMTFNIGQSDSSEDDKSVILYIIGWIASLVPIIGFFYKWRQNHNRSMMKSESESVEVSVIGKRDHLNTV